MFCLGSRRHSLPLSAPAEQTQRAETDSEQRQCDGKRRRRGADNIVEVLAYRERMSRNVESRIEVDVRIEGRLGRLQG